ncbi:hypothetical protein [Brucella anthropi]|uniref:hypothetical protein n=1 Tax=Brucella anthropi TaxID=529 RepID=UPI00124D787C|nr:hypothetical protein [Brucella anthropi]KAB2743540.1 hypothetical protein F9L05_23025 [Brucella anthropi]
MLWLIFGVVCVALIVFVAVRTSKPESWRVSESGNQTQIYGGSRVTVFPSDGGWKYCISAPFGDDDPYYSDRYATQEEAMECGMAFLDVRPDPHKTMREIREERALHSALNETSSSIPVLKQLTDAINDMHLKGKFLVKDITAIKKTSDKQKRALVEVYKHHYIEDRETEAANIWQTREGFSELSEHCDALLVWLRSAPKDERGEPPDFRQASSAD